MRQNRVRELRMALNLSQEQLGESTNISQQIISKIENDDERLTKDNMIALANFFQVSTDYLLGRSNSRRILEQEAEHLGQYERNYDFLQKYEVLGDKGKELLEGMAALMAKLEIG